MERFKDDECKLDLGFGRYSRFRLYVGDYYLLLWAGDIAACLPRSTSESISDYTHLEVELRDSHSVPIDPATFGLPWSEYGRFSPKRGMRQSVETIRKLIDYLTNKQGLTVSTETQSNVKPRQEAPCKQCKNMNDLGVAECWWCGCSYPC